MRSLERLEKNHRLEQRRKRAAPPPDEEMEEEMDFHPFAPLNTAASVFDKDIAKRFGGINTAPSIFDKGATFHIKE